MKNYRMTFGVKANNSYYVFAKDVSAGDKKEAREVIEAAWYRGHKNHMFHIDIRPLPKGKPCEYLNFTDVTKEVL